jgi:hypothetical protein
MRTVLGLVRWILQADPELLRAARRLAARLTLRTHRVGTPAWPRGTGAVVVRCSS